MRHTQRRSAGRARGRGMLRVGAVLCLLGCLEAPATPARPPSEDVCMVVNSDMSVNKYKTVQTSFKESAACRTVEIDVGAGDVQGSDLEKAIKTNKPKVLYCIGSKAYLLTRDLVPDKDVILSSAINWQRFQIGARTYGIANELSTEMQLTLFRYFFMEVKTIGILYSEEYNKEWVKSAVADGKALGVRVVAQAVSKPKGVNRALEKILPGVDALWLIPDPVVLSDADAIGSLFKQADEAKKPVFAYNEAFADYGAVMIISPDDPTVGRQAAGLVEQVLDRKPISERIQNPAGSEIVLNVKSVEKYGLKLNQDALDSVNRIIK